MPKIHKTTILIFLFAFLSNSILLAQKKEINETYWMAHFDKKQNSTLNPETFLIDSIRLIQNEKQTTILNPNESFFLEIYPRNLNRYFCEINVDNKKLYISDSFSVGKNKVTIGKDQINYLKKSPLSIKIINHIGDVFLYKIQIKFKDVKPKIIRPSRILNLMINDNPKNENLKNTNYKINNKISPGELVEILGSVQSIDDSIVNFEIISNSKLITLNNISIKPSVESRKLYNFQFKLKTAMIGLDDIILKFKFERVSGLDSSIITIPFEKSLDWENINVEDEFNLINIKTEESKILESTNSIFLNSLYFENTYSPISHRKFNIVHLNDLIYLEYLDKIDYNSKFERVQFVKYKINLHGKFIEGTIIDLDSLTKTIKIIFPIDKRAIDSIQMITVDYILRHLIFESKIKRIHVLSLGTTYFQNDKFSLINSITNTVINIGYLTNKRFGAYLDINLTLNNFHVTSSNRENDIILTENTLLNTDSNLYYVSTGNYLNQTLNFNFGVSFRINKYLYAGIGAGIIQRKIYKEYLEYNYLNNLSNGMKFANCADLEINSSYLANIKLGYHYNKINYNIQYSRNVSTSNLTFNIGYEI